MKRFCAVILALFAFLVAPTIPQTPSLASMPPMTATIEDGPKGNPLAFLFGDLEDEPDPVVQCQSVDGSDKCVPKYRLSDEINDHSTQRAIKWIEVANKAGANELLLELNTPGGSVDAGFELARAIEDSAAPVSCVVDGDGASMGFYILQSCNKRYMTKRSKIMAHEPALGGNMRGTPNQWQAIADMLKAEREAIAEHCVKRLKVSMKEYRSKTDGGQMWFMVWHEALKVGAVDDIAESVKKLHEKMLK